AAVLGYYRRLAGLVDIRLHDTPLYNSIYRFDDEMIVNMHVYGILAAYTPVMHLRRVDGAYFNTYLESFERVRASARPLDSEDRWGRRSGRGVLTTGRTRTPRNQRRGNRPPAPWCGTRRAGCCCSAAPTMTCGPSRRAR